MSQPRHRWQSKPGSFDALNASRVFPADYPLGILTVHHTPLTAIPETLLARPAEPRPDHAVLLVGGSIGRTARLFS